jgi:hypothetical protein
MRVLQLIPKNYLKIAIAIEVGLCILVVISTIRAFAFSDVYARTPILYIWQLPNEFVNGLFALGLLGIVFVFRAKQPFKSVILSSSILLFTLFLSYSLLADFYLEEIKVDSHIYRLIANTGSMCSGWKYTIYECDQSGFICYPAERGHFTPFECRNVEAILKPDGTLNSERIDFWRVYEAERTR